MDVASSESVSVEQERHGAIEQAIGGAPASACLMAVRVDGPLNVKALRESVNEMVRRHSALRSVFPVSGVRRGRNVAPSLSLEIEVLNLSLLPESEWEGETLRQASEEISRPFDLAAGPLVRTSLLRFGRASHVLLLVAHATVFDDESAEIALRELAALYESFASGQPSALPRPPLEDADFARWQRQWLASPDASAHLAYWKERLSGELPGLQLSTDRHRPPVASLRGAVVSGELAPEIARALAELGQREGVQLSVTLLAAWATLLHRYTEQDEILIGTPVPGRSHPASKHLIGRFSYPVVLRTRLSSGMSFRGLVREVADVTASAEAHSDLPFAKIVEELRPPPDKSRHPLFQASFALQKARSAVRAKDLVLTPLEIARPAAEVDVALTVKLEERRLIATLAYSTDLFERDAAERMLGHFQTLLAGAAMGPDRPIAELPILSEEERQKLLVTWNDTSAEYPEGRCIHQLFEQQAERTPDAIAVAFEGRHLSYRDLNRRANQLAHHLRDMGVRPDVIVGLSLERGLDLIVGILGILKAGGAFLPLDPTYPKDRLAFMLEDSKAPVLVTQRSLSNSLGPHAAYVLCIDALHREREDSPKTGVTARSLAYVIYTSGSTGKPKGVLLEHRGLCNLTEAQLRIFNVRPESRVLQFARLSFDASVWEIFMALRAGAALCMVPQEALLPGPDFFFLLRDQAISVVTLPPSMLAVLPSEELPSLRTLIVAGEACPDELVARWAPGRRFFNAYGPTETTVCATVAECIAGRGRPPIGRPIANMQVYVLDRALQPVPIGVPGELHVGGAGLARGYLNRPELSAQKFIKHPFSTDPEARLYKTGDLVKWLPDGSLDFLGRIDQQVKVRGFRIELEEIESVLARHPALREVALMVREDVPGDKRLVAYVVARKEPGPATAELRSFLKEQLPSFMIPSAIVVLDALPLTPSGKVDRRALPAPGRATGSKDAPFVPPRAPIEEVLAALWAELFGCERVGLNDNFLELGGHSLMAVQLMARVRDLYRVDLSMRALFEAPTVYALAKVLEAARSGDQSARARRISRVSRDQPLPLSFAQLQVWLLVQLEPRVPFYNESATLRMRGPLNVEALERGLAEIIRRHEILRTTFAGGKAQPMQTIWAASRFSLTKLDLRGEPKPVEEAVRLATEEAKRPFALGEGPLIRAMLAQIGDEEHRLYLTLHHIITDGVSLNTVLIKELSALYVAFCAGEPSPLPDLPIQYGDFAVWQRRTQTVEALDDLIIYWDRKLAGLSVLELPTDRPRPAVQSFRGATCSFEIPYDIMSSLKTLCRQEGTTLFMTLLAAFKAFLHRYAAGQEDIVVGTAAAGRIRPELEPLLGFFVNPLVLRTDASGDPTFREFLRRVREVTLEAYAHQNVPFEMLLEELRVPRTRSHNPLFQVVFVLEPPQQVVSTGWTISQHDVDGGTSKFDLTLYIDERPEGSVARFEYDTDLFDASTIERMVTYFQRLLEYITVTPDVRLSAVPLLTDEERRRMLGRSDQCVSSRVDATIHALFEAQALRTPSATAVVYESARLTYRELDRRANQLANHLRKLGVQPETRVALYLERSIDAIVAVLAILKAGGAYVPLDPEEPPARISAMLKDAGTPLIVTQQSLTDRLEGTAARIVRLDSERAVIAGAPASRPEGGAGPEHLAYVMYTGSATGKPKGAMVTHANVARLFRAAREIFEVGVQDVWTMFHSCAFDFSVWEMWGALLHGGKLVIVPHSARRSPEALYELLSLHRVTILNLIPSVFRQLSYVEESQEEVDQRPLHLRLVCLGGEPLDFRTLKPWLDRHGDREPRIYNLYGMTGATVLVTCRPVTLVDAVDVTGSRIGLPLPDVEIYILDKKLQPVPIGVPGELYVGGGGVARGYLNRPDLTAERFLENPWKPGSAARLHRTGDRARYLPDGDIEYLGRVDQQMKLRGFRIEPTEIEAVVTEHPDVREAVVMVREDTPGDQRLVAYYVKRAQRIPTTNELRSFLKEKLPDYMVPTIFVVVPSIPVIANGKVNRKSLPAPDRNRPSLMPIFRLPSNPVEVLLLGIWTRLLQVDQIGIKDDFFSLGGHSLLAAQMLARVRETFRIDMRHSSFLMRAFLENPTIAGLSEAVDLVRDATPSVRGRRNAAIDWSAESALDPSIRFDGPRAQSSAEPSAILLTGGTGFLGAFLIHELLRETRADIYCLVRAPDVESARQRLRRNLIECKLQEDAESPRIIPVPGDLSQVLFGLAPERFSELARKIDVIFHNGALVNFIYPYPALRAPNVGGTREVIRLATQARVKPVHYVSTVAVLASFGFFGVKQVGEDVPLAHPERLYMGYVESKWAAEKMLMNAAQEGLPLSIYRPHDVTGDTRTGAWKTDGFLCSFLKALAELGSAPDIRFPLDFGPVDYVTRAIVHIARHAPPSGKVYHLSNERYGQLTSAVERMRLLGYPVQRLPHHAWVQKLVDHAARHPTSPISPFVPLFVERWSEQQLTLLEMYSEERMPAFDCKNTHEALRGTDIVCPPVDDALLDRYLSYFHRTGFFPPPPGGG